MPEDTLQTGKKIPGSKVDGFVKSLLGRHPGEPRIRSGAGAGGQNILKKLDSGFRRNDVKPSYLTFYEFINRLRLIQMQ